MKDNRFKKARAVWFPSGFDTEHGISPRESTYHNIIRLRVIAAVSAAVMVVLIYMDLLVLELAGPKPLVSTLPYLIAMRLIVIGVSVAFLIKIGRPASPDEITARHHFSVLAYLLFGIIMAAVLTGLSQPLKAGLTTYLTAVFVIAVFIYLNGPESLLIYGLGWSVLAMTIWLFQKDGLLLLSNVTGGGLMTGLALVVSRITRRTRAREAADRLLIEDQRKELERAARLLELNPLMDSITGVPNRRHMDEFLNREWRRAAREGHRLTMIVADLDYFAKYNEIYGRQVGDQCLKDVAAELVRTVSRAGDLVARYNGGAFAVILGNNDLYGVFQIGQKLGQAISDLQIEHAGSEEGKVTASLGLATLRPEADQAPEILIQAVDRALAQAKANGRNQCHWTGLTTESTAV